jgi:hypothetical protein
MFAAIEEVFHSFYAVTTKTFCISGSPGFKGFILCPDGSVEDLKDRFLRFRREKRLTCLHSLSQSFCWNLLNNPSARAADL